MFSVGFHHRTMRCGCFVVGPSWVTPAHNELSVVRFRENTDGARFNRGSIKVFGSPLQQWYLDETWGTCEKTAVLDAPVMVFTEVKTVSFVVIVVFDCSFVLFCFFAVFNFEMSTCLYLCYFTVFFIVNSFFLVTIFVGRFSRSDHTLKMTGCKISEFHSFFFYKLD